MPETDPIEKPGRPSSRHLAADSGDGILARIAAQRRSFKEALHREREKTNSLQRDLEARNAELAKLKPLADGSRVGALEAELATLKHRGRFDTVARDAGARPEALDDLYKLSGYQAEGEPDDGKIKAAIDAQKTGRAYLFGSVEDASAGVERPAQPGPGSGRGAGTSAPPARYTEAQLSDPAFVMANWDANVKQAQAALDRGLVR